MACVSINNITINDKCDYSNGLVAQYIKRLKNTHEWGVRCANQWGSRPE